MAVHESGVNFQNLIRDLAEMYPFEVPEVVLTELVANSLDSGATSISIQYRPDTRSLVVSDNGKGMIAQEFEQYHDFAAGLKTRGSGIGFAGVGAKIAFNAAERVVTETRSRSFTGGSDWYFRASGKLVWDDVTPATLRGEGTRVEVYFRPDVALPFDSGDDILALLERHYLPLLDTDFLALYEALGLYSPDLRFSINGTVVTPRRAQDRFHLEHVREFFPERKGKRVGYGLLGLAEVEYPLGPDRCGVLLCTHGKVVRADLFNQFPGPMGPRIVGVVEVPDLIGFLTTSKTDFARWGRNRDFEALYDPVRAQFREWLAELGVQSPETARTEETVRLERELRKLLDDVPELGEFFGSWGPKRVLAASGSGEIGAHEVEGADVTFPDGEGSKRGGSGPVDVGDRAGTALVEADPGDVRATPISRRGRRGPQVSFVDAPERAELAWVEGSIVAINSGHPAYARVRTNSTARVLYSLLVIGMAIQRFFAMEEKLDLNLVDRMMGAWAKK